MKDLHTRYWAAAWRLDKWLYAHCPPILWPVCWPYTIGWVLLLLALGLLTLDLFTPRAYRK